jgi:hypothetical protein
MSSRDSSRTREGGVLELGHHGEERAGWRVDWFCEQWEQDKVNHVMRKLERDDRLHDDFVPHNLGGRTIYRPRSEGLPSEFLREYDVDPDNEIFVPGNLLLNEGIGRLLDLLTAAGGVAYNNANAFIGVGDSATAEAATQTELAAATNRFYKAMVATYPVSPGSNGAQSRDWRSDFTTTEANYAWQEWSICAGATTASGAGFTSGTTNLNRKVQSLGTKATGTWTMTGTVTIS